MSYWISLIDKEGTIPEVESFQEGGTQVIGGSNEADLNVTYNYAKHFPFRDLHEKKASDTLPMFDEAIARLKDDVKDDYWEPTEGNTKAALLTLRRWAKQHPDYSWNVN